MHRLLQALKAKILGKKLALSHEEDADGIVSAALFLRKYPEAILVLGRPQEIRRDKLNWINLFTWDFVADLPCPKKAKIRVDHHKTNTPCAEIEYYDPEAPCAAILALKALKLENDPEMVRLVELAIQTDTANIKEDDAWDLNDAVKGADYKGRLWLAQALAREGLSALKNYRVKKWIEKNRRRREKTEKIAALINVKEITLIEFEKDIDISYRGLCAILEKRGAKFMTVIVPKDGIYRPYIGASKDSTFDASIVATRLGGGGHKVAAGARVERKEKIYEELKRYLRKERLEITVIKENLKTLKKVV
ncbi:MAG: Fis family transcriptional regulator [Thermofilum sp. ex4484_82]|nr:MAG: Fis family transcriptional regulator [Thermofilum sp. ex4484_82]OYT38925.1 MAG: Fis family transcriptional regulator [Archaeoglobales archaeon ex4484_92]